MQVYGSSPDQVLFKRYGLKVLEKANMDYERALPRLEIYLGAVFCQEGAGSSQGEKCRADIPCTDKIYDTEIDSYRELYGAKAVAARLDLYFCHEIGHMIQKNYLPLGSPYWGQLEGNLGFPLDFNLYYCKAHKRIYCMAYEVAATLFEYAIKGYTKIHVDQVRDAKKEYIEETKTEALIVKERRSYEIKIKPHVWRKWFYHLWGQSYEWGSFRPSKKYAEANGIYYALDIPPRIVHQQSFAVPKTLLEAHGFTVQYYEDGTVEYWR